MKPFRLLSLLLLFGLAGCQAAGGGPVPSGARQQQPDGGLGGTGHTGCPTASADRRGRDAVSMESKPPVQCR